MGTISPSDLKNKRLRSGRKELKADCPYCNASGKIYVNISRGLYYCQRCHAKGRITGQIVKDIFGQVVQKEEKPELIPTICQPVQEVPLALDYLRRRNLEPYQDWVYCSYGKYHNRILMPVYFRGKYRGFIGRSLNPREPHRYLTSLHFPTSKVLWGFDRLREEGTATIAEGIFDASKFEDGVATFTNRLSDVQASSLASRVDMVEIAYDRGVVKPVITAGLQLFNYGIYNVSVVLIPKKDPAECTKEELQKAERTSIWNLIEHA